MTDRDRGAGMIKVFLLMRLLPRVLSSISSAKASHAQLPDMPLRIDTQALRLIARIPLIQRREKHHSRKGKAPSRSSFPLSMYVVLNTRHVNPISTYVDIRARYVAQTYLPLIHNFSPYADQ